MGAASDSLKRLGYWLRVAGVMLVVAGPAVANPAQSPVEVLQLSLIHISEPTRLQ